MINEKKIKNLLSGLLLFAFMSPVGAAELDDSDMLLAERGNERTARQTTSDGSSRSSDERPSRPKDERPSRPREANHEGPHNVGGPQDHHNSEPPHHHHHDHGGTVVVVEEEPVYVSNYSDSSNEIYVAGDYDIDRFMLFVNLGCGVSFRSAYGTHEPEDDVEEDVIELDNSFFESLGYSFELRMDVGVTKHFFVSPGVAFAKQSVCTEFSPGNYLVNKKRFLDMPFFLGYRKSTSEGVVGSVSAGPRFVYGINGKCQEYYDFYPAPEHGVFEHDSYGGKYGKEKFSVGLGLETSLVLDRVLLGFDFSIYPRSDCEPSEIYDGLFSGYYHCRKNFSVKIGWRVF